MVIGLMLGQISNHSKSASGVDTRSYMLANLVRYPWCRSNAGGLRIHYTSQSKAGRRWLVYGPKYSKLWVGDKTLNPAPQGLGGI